MTKVAPSILSADWSNMTKVMKDLDDWNVDWIHFDSMDGVYVPNITFGMQFVKALRPHSKKIFDVHLMITQPEKYVGDFCDAGADYVTFHPDASKDVRSGLNIIKSKGKKCGLVINADQPFSIVEDYLDQVDMILIMTVQAGFGGQKFREDCLEKVKIAKQYKEQFGYCYEIQLDGGICPENIEKCVKYGATAVVAGSSVFNATSPKDAVKQMQI